MQQLSVVAPQLSVIDQGRVVRRVRRIMSGAPESTPSPVLLQFTDVGLLFFLNEKQSQLHELLANVDVSAHEGLKPLSALVELMTFLVGGLIVEAERIDEQTITIRKELTVVANELRSCDIDLQQKRMVAGSVAEQTIAQFFKTRANVPARARLGRNEMLEKKNVEEDVELVTSINALRERKNVLQLQLKALTKVQKLLHGSGRAIPEVEAAAIVSDLGLLPTFRKANHKVRDAVFDVPQRDELQAITSLLEFLTYLDCGMTTALLDMQQCELTLNKAIALLEKDEKVERLRLLDARNKELSCAALRQNESLGKGLLVRNNIAQIAALRQPDNPLPNSQTATFAATTATVPSPYTPAGFALPPYTLTPNITSGPTRSQSSRAQSAQQPTLAESQLQPPADDLGHANEMEEFLKYYCT